jgi:hypothetical protein
MSDDSQTTDQYGVPLAAGILEAERVMNNNIRECLYADDQPVYVPTMRAKIIGLIKEAKNRISNAYDCLVKGVDPYDY